MILFPNCKINLGLWVTGKRDDGYHNLETIFYPLPLRDAAELTTCPVKKDNSEPFELTVTGTSIPGDPDSNLCTKAWQLIHKDFPGIPSVRMHLHKAIPVGAGLGGGSSDGAFTLLLLNEELKLNLPYDRLLRYALELGSDCPFFILNKPCIATGRGEKMEEVIIDLNDFFFIIVDPEIHISTKEAFDDLAASRSDEKRPKGNSLKKIISQPVSTWKNELVNEFEEPVFRKYPRLKEIKQKLYDAGAEYAAMTGTGSSVYGIFPNNKKAGNLSVGLTYKVYILNHSH